MAEPTNHGRGSLAGRGRGKIFDPKAIADAKIAQTLAQIPAFSRWEGVPIPDDLAAMIAELSHQQLLTAAVTCLLQAEQHGRNESEIR